MSDDQRAVDQTGARDPEGSPFTRPGFLISAGVVLIIVVLAGFLILTGDDEPPSNAPSTGAPSNSATGSPQAPVGDDDVCVVQVDDDSVPVAGPPAQWTLIGTVAAPSSDEAGPAVTDAATGIRSCYAQTPTGALFAAANFLAAVSDPQLLETAVDQLAAEGPGRDALLEQVRNDPASAIGTGARYQIAGFTFLSAGRDVTSISVAIAATGGLAGVPLTVVREDGDWKVDLPPDGDPAGQAEPITSLAGYTAWSGA